jgi:DNA polymerase III delta subunit
MASNTRRLDSLDVADLKPAYLVHGDDEVKIDAWRKRVRARADSDGPSTTLEILDDGASPAAVVDATTALTLSVGRRYVLAEGAERWKDKDVASVKAALESLPPDTVLVLIGRGKVSRGKGPAPEALAKAVLACGGEVHVCAAPAASRYPAWIAERGKDIDIVVAEDAAQALLERLGPDQQRLMRELEKLACYEPEGGRVDRETVEALTTTDVEAKAYELADALIEQEPERALLLAEDLRDRGADIMHILFALLRQLRQCRRAWAMLDAGKSSQEIQAALRVPPFVARGIVAQAGRADGERLERALGELADLDYAVRGAGNVDPGTALTLTLARAAA